MALNAPMHAANEGVRGDMGWSTFRERHMKATYRYKVRLERMDDSRLARKVYLWNGRYSKWGKRWARMTNVSGVNIGLANRLTEDGVRVYEWLMINRNGEGSEWDVKKWKTEIDRVVKDVGLRKWRNEMEKKKTLEWYKEKKVPSYESLYDGSLGSDLLFQARTQCMDVNARNYRWSESGSKECQMCDMGEDETVEHVILECEKYDRERMEMMRVVLDELGCEMNEVVEMTGREWMVLLLGLCGETCERVMDAVKVFLEKMWCVRIREHRV